MEGVRTGASGMASTAGTAAGADVGDADDEAAADGSSGKELGRLNS